MKSQSINSFLFFNPHECVSCQESPANLWAGHKVVTNNHFDHWLCLPCSKNWFEKNKGCPICRAELEETNRCYAFLSQGEWLVADQIEGIFKKIIDKHPYNEILELATKNEISFSKLKKIAPLKLKTLIALATSDILLKKDICFDLMLNAFYEAEFNDFKEILNTMPEDQKRALLFFKSKQQSLIFKMQLGINKGNKLGICKTLITHFHPAVYLLFPLIVASFSYRKEIFQELSNGGFFAAIILINSILFLMLRKDKIYFTQKGSPEAINCAGELALTLENDNEKTIVLSDLINHGSDEAIAWTKELTLTFKEDEAKAVICAHLMKNENVISFRCAKEIALTFNDSLLSQFLIVMLNEGLKTMRPLE